MNLRMSTDLDVCVPGYLREEKHTPLRVRYKRPIKIPINKIFWDEHKKHEKDRMRITWPHQMYFFKFIFCEAKSTNQEVIRKRSTMASQDIYTVASDPEWSDDEKDADYDWRTVTIPFGKYEGRTMGTMILRSRTRSYMRYMVKWDELDHYLKVAANAGLTEYTTELKKPKDKRAWNRAPPPSASFSVSSDMPTRQDTQAQTPPSSPHSSPPRTGPRFTTTKPNQRSRRSHMDD